MDKELSWDNAEGMMDIKTRLNWDNDEDKLEIIKTKLPKVKKCLEEESLRVADYMDFFDDGGEIQWMIQRIEELEKKLNTPVCNHVFEPYQHIGKYITGRCVKCGFEPTVK